MFSQHCQEIYITVANLHPEYLRFLDGEERIDDNLADQSLELELYGPLKIFDPPDMQVFGWIAVPSRRFSARVLYAYFDDKRLRVQYTEPLGFEQLAMRPEPGVTLMESIDWDEHWKKIDTLVRWSRPMIRGDITAE